MKKRLLCGLLCLVLLLTAAPLAGAESATAATMRLEKTQGSVNVQNDAGADVKLIERMRLFDGYTVATAEDSYAWFMLDDTKACKLDESSSIRIEKDGKRLKLTLETGSVFFNITEKLTSAESLEIRTGTMVTGIRGTSGWVRVWSDTRSELALLDGLVQVSALNADGTTRAGSTIEIGAGELAESNIGGWGRALLNGRISYRDVPSFVGREIADDPLLQNRIDNAGAVRSDDIIDNIETKAQEEALAEHEHVHTFGAPTYVWTNNHGFCTATAICTGCSRQLSESIASVLVTTAAQCETAGQNQWTAAFTTPGFTAQTFTAVIAALGHNYTAVVTAPTCTARGYTTHTCTRCGASYTDSFVDALGHEWGEPAIRFSEDGKTANAEQLCAHDKNHVLTTAAEVASEMTAKPDCENAGATTYTATAVVDGDTYTATKTVADIPALGHSFGEGEDDVEYRWEEDFSNCTASGICTVCEELVEEEALEITAEVTAEATCTETGEITYSAVFENEAFKEQTATVEIPMLPHSFGDVEYSWDEEHTSCTARHVCVECEEPEEETVKASSEETAIATCTETGEITYTAVFENEAFETQTEPVEIPKLPHKYGEVTYTWADDHASCKASHVCAECGEPEEETVEASFEETAPATCTEPGEITYTAVFENEAFETQTATEEIPVLPHSFGDVEYSWDEEYTSCTAKRICVECEEPEEETVKASSEVTAKATCTESGEITYTAVFKNEAFKTQTEPVKVEPLDHDYGTPTYQWAGDNSSCTATTVCSRDSSHTVSETAKAMANKTDEGTQYSVKFENPLFAPQSKTEKTVTDPDNDDGIVDDDIDENMDDNTDGQSGDEIVKPSDTPIVVGDDVDTPIG